MSANDPGHIKEFLKDNLDKNQELDLKNLWKLIIENKERIFDENHEKELFYAFGSDNPDVLLLRFLRAKKWNINLAFEQLIETIKWRIQSNVNQIVFNGENHLSYEEILTGKTFYLGQDKFGRPINYVSVKDHIKGQFPSESTEKLTIFTMETGRKLLKYPNESVTVIFDMNKFSMKNMDYQHVKFLINLLQNYYPECLGLGLIVNAPWLFTGCWHIIKPWLDPVVESKIHFIKNLDDLTKFIDLSNLSKRFNGYHADFNYIPPTEQDNRILSTIREDYYGKAKANEYFQQTSMNYLQITLEWINENDDQINLLEKRKKATEQLKYAYQQFIPYISTKTHYHRIGTYTPSNDLIQQTIQLFNQLTPQLHFQGLPYQINLRPSIKSRFITKTKAKLSITSNS
ncbi:unnamed protein product [Adineta steineri]|uniref:CRAL-TRIO domain-containing protein n=1 Tax=Adineta steineri TaxID=433720 RepID=A0A818TAS5_9BILA|nr:unnamed protein product [Adineta steineri]CAF3674856.1 unnamed protein product [Adineta steineri]